MGGPATASAPTSSTKKWPKSGRCTCIYSAYSIFTVQSRAFCTKLNIRLCTVGYTENVLSIIIILNRETSFKYLILKFVLNTLNFIEIYSLNLIKKSPCILYRICGCSNGSVKNDLRI